MLIIRNRNKFQNKLRKNLKRHLYSRLLPQKKKMLLIKANLFQFLNNLFNLNLWVLEGIIPKLLLEEAINFWEVKTQFKEVHLLRLHLSILTPWVLEEDQADKPELLEILVNNQIISFPLKALQIRCLVNQLRIILGNNRVTMEMEGWTTFSQLLQMVIQGLVPHGWKIWQDKPNLHGFKATTMLQEDPYSVHNQTNSRTQCLDLQVCQEEISCPIQILSQTLPLHQWTQVWCRHVNDDST